MPLLSDLEGELIKGGSARSKLIQNLTEIINLIKSCKNSLSAMKFEIQNFQEKCNASKTVGTSVGVVGAALATVGCVGAIFTGGTSLVLTAGALGTAYSVTGAAINVTTSIVDIIKTKGYLKDINEVLSKIQKKEKKMTASLNKFKETIEFIRKSFSLKEDVAWSVTNQFYAMGRNLQSGVEQMGSILIFALGLAFAQPCSANPAVVLAEFVHQFHPVITQGVRYVPPQLAVETTKQAVKYGVGEATKETLKVAESVLAKSALKESGKMTLKTSGKILQGALAGLNIGLAIYDIVTLVKSWKETHPAVEVILQTMTSLDTMQIEVQNQVDALVETLTDILEEDESASESDSESSSSSEEEDDKIRIFDISPQTFCDILRAANLSVGNYSSSQDPESALRDLLGKIESRSFGPSDYFTLISLLQDCISNKGSKFDRDRRDVSKINLSFGNNSVEFDSSKREYLSHLLTPIHNVMYKRKLYPPLNFCCIYRFHCVLCAGSREFNYVGQTRNFRSRYGQHELQFLTTWMDQDDFLSTGFRNPVGRHSSVLYEHKNHFHYDRVRNSEVFEVDVVQRLPDHSGTSRLDSRARRSWEVFYQWLYKAKVQDGGGSQR